MGYRLMQDTMGAGNVTPADGGRDRARSAERSRGDIVRLTGELGALDGVEDVRGMNTPLGRRTARMAGLLRVDLRQLRCMARWA
ncbi:MAG: hypothetical protein M5U29_03165 [Anaerolineae bacterium]|nr:hypothetical protein [Anaerolineae bacterium]